MADDFAHHQKGLESPASKGFEITPDDNADLAPYTRAIYVGGGGDLNVILADDTTAVVFPEVAAGSILPLRIKRVLDTDTTATSLVGLL